jgi:uncharacterized damage-inducible protein DinB
MLAKSDVTRLLDYTVWANHRVMRAAATVSVDDFKRDLGGSHGGLRGTLAHMMGAEWIWLERFKGVSPTRGLDEGEFANLLELRDRWTIVEEHRASWLQSLPEAALTEMVRYSSLAGAAFENPLWKLVQHVANHSSYHRGQVVLLLRLLGARPVSTDMVAWDRDHPEVGSAGKAAS